MPLTTAIIAIAASIYIYSGVGKLDYLFAYSVGQAFLDALSSPLGGIPNSWTSDARAIVALLFPLAEILTGVGLLIPRFRRGAAALLMLMHVGLVLVLSPGLFWLRGLNHSVGVLLWNALMCGQAFVLWRTGSMPLSQLESSTAIPSNQSAGWHKQSARIFVGGVVIAAVVAPLMERWGYWDHWPSWALYSPHTSRVDVQLHRSVINRLPASVQKHVREDTDGDRWHTLDLAGWSLGQRYAPVYPQARYQLLLAIHLADRLPLDDEIRATVRHAASRRDGRRQERPLLGRSELQSAQRAYWLTRWNAP